MRRMPTEKDFVRLVHVNKINEIDNEILENLRAGDIVIKHTGNQEHAYRVTYKEEHQGICISYYDASRVETVSYDYVEGHWVYNSTDVTVIGE